MGKSTAWQSGHLKLLFQNIPFNGVGDSGGLLSSAASGRLFVSLHTASLGNSSDQSLYEATYGSYARVGISRGVSSWTVTGSSVTNAAAITFPSSTSGSETISHFAIGVAPSGSGMILYTGVFETARLVASGDDVSIGAGCLTVTES